jgi:DNA polymerase III alpha subunit (gram-positive type)
MFVFIDTETGGLSPDYSLLTVAAAVTDKEFNILDTLQFSLRPSNTYVVSPEAMQVNKIDLAQHAGEAIYPDSARLKFENLLTEGLTRTGLRRLVPAGHNVGFDLSFLYAQIMPESDFRKYCTYPALDTASVARFLANAGVIKSPCNLVSLREQFGIDTGTAHSAHSDVLATIQLAKLFTSFLKGVPNA